MGPNPANVHNLLLKTQVSAHVWVNVLQAVEQTLLLMSVLNTYHMQHHDQRVFAADAWAAQSYCFAMTVFSHVVLF